MVNSGDLPASSAPPKGVVTPVDGGEEAAAAIQATLDAASIAAFEKAGDIATGKMPDGTEIAVQGQAKDVKVPAPPAEERPDFIDEADWKGTIKSSVEALKSKKHFEKKAEEKRDPQAEKVASYFTDARIAELNNDLAKNRGQLSDEMRKSLRGVGLPDILIDTHLEGLNSILERNTLLAMAEVGGEEAYGAMMEWFGKLSAADQSLLAPHFQAKDKEVVKAAARALKNNYFAANGREARLIAGSRAPSGDGGAQPFRSPGEKQAAINDPRYLRDDEIGESFRRHVDARILAARRAGIAV